MYPPVPPLTSLLEEGPRLLESPFSGGGRTGRPDFHTRLLRLLHPFDSEPDRVLPVPGYGRNKYRLTSNLERDDSYVHLEVQLRGVRVSGPLPRSTSRLLTRGTLLTRPQVVHPQFPLPADHTLTPPPVRPQRGPALLLSSSPLQFFLRTGRATECGH